MRSGRAGSKPVGRRSEPKAKDNRGRRLLSARHYGRSSVKQSLPIGMFRASHRRSTLDLCRLTRSWPRSSAFRATNARVAEELLSSIEEPDDEASAAWVAELEKRSQEVAKGSVQLTPWETTHAEVTKELAQRRARRSPS
jgi:hypothetical protein